MSAVFLTDVEFRECEAMKAIVGVDRRKTMRGEVNNMNDNNR